MNKIYFFAMVSLLSVTLHGQVPSKQQNIRKLIDIATKGQLGDSVAAMMLNGFKKQYPQADSAFWKSIEPDINMNSLFDQLMPVYDKYYTEDDVRQLLAFYDQPIGPNYPIAGFIYSITSRIVYRPANYWKKNCGPIRSPGPIVIINSKCLSEPFSN